MTYFKAVQPDGTDFYTGTVQWVPESGIPSEGFAVTHPTSTVWGVLHSTHLCASTSPTDCIGFRWPCRLLAVEPLTEIHRHVGTKVSALSWRVVRELPATQALGPQGEAAAAFIDGLRRLDAESLARLADAARDPAWSTAWSTAWYAARDTARDTARIAARDAAWEAARKVTWAITWDIARDSTRDAARDAARDASVALVVWDLIDPDQRDILTAPIRTALPDLWAEVTAYLPLTS